MMDRPRDQAVDQVDLPHAKPLITRAVLTCATECLNNQGSGSQGASVSVRKHRLFNTSKVSSGELACRAPTRTTAWRSFSRYRPVHLSDRAPPVTQLSRSPVATENRCFPLQIGHRCLSSRGDPNTCQSIPSRAVGAAVLPPERSRASSGLRCSGLWGDSTPQQ